MAKRKIFIKTDLSIPRVEYSRSCSGKINIAPEAIPPNTTAIRFSSQAKGGDTFDFGRWYGAGIDPIVYICQKQIERFLDYQDAELSRRTLKSYCNAGLRTFLNYVTVLSTEQSTELTVENINRALIDGYINFLNATDVETITKKSQYTNTKAVLKALCRRGLIHEVRVGDNATFPKNPFPGMNSKQGGEKPLPKRERKAFTAAVTNAVMPIFSDGATATSELLSYALLVIALHTGRNTWPLLEMTRDCLHSHPKDNTHFLMLYKRRSHSMSKVVIQADRNHDADTESMLTVRPTVAALITRLIQLSDVLREDAPEHIKNRIWLYRPQGGHYAGVITSLKSDSLTRAVKNLIDKYGLVDADSKPMRINVSRLRKTFINRVYEILEGDLATTAVAAGNTVQVTSIHYLRPSENSQKNWKFMGVALVQELLTRTVGATERTPVGQCSDPQNGEYAPKQNDGICMSFFNCLRCRNYVVTADDLYRLYSFYWRILQERARMAPLRWKRQFSHVVRLIDRDVIEAGISQGVFKQAIVDKERERARHNPHPFWISKTIVSDIEGIL